MNNTLTLICSQPGGGKSTVAKALVRGGYADVYYEADMWMMVDGEYYFDFTKLGYAHKSCQDACRNALIDGKNVIVSNTNVTTKDRAPYIKMAKELGCAIQLIRLDGKFGSIHNVPEETVKRFEQKLNDEWGKDSI